MSKAAYLWVVTWQDGNVTAELFFSSRESFEKLLSRKPDYSKTDQLLQLNVPDWFDNWDYIPEDY